MPCYDYDNLLTGRCVCWFSFFLAQFTLPQDGLLFILSIALVQDISLLVHGHLLKGTANQAWDSTKVCRKYKVTV